ncbi:MAG: diacylglycerol kinase [Candidatus Hydrogenedentes bacterium]|nr:diacylglycerol kinase [Candidatus Hydrogenedentota bacterium]
MEDEDFLKYDARAPYPIRKFKTFLSGMRYAVSDFVVLYKVVVAIIVVAATYSFREWVDFLVVLVATSQVIVVELVNTAIEQLCDFVEPEKNEAIRKTKDIAAAAASIAMSMWVLVIVYQVAQLIYDLNWFAG